jgi:hypothetical protein
MFNLFLIYPLAPAAVIRREPDEITTTKYLFLLVMKAILSVLHFYHRIPYKTYYWNK